MECWAESLWKKSILRNNPSWLCPTCFLLLLAKHLLQRMRKKFGVGVGESLCPGKWDKAGFLKNQYLIKPEAAQF